MHLSDCAQLRSVWFGIEAHFSNRSPGHALPEVFSWQSQVVPPTVALISTLPRGVKEIGLFLGNWNQPELLKSSPFWKQFMVIATKLPQLGRVQLEFGGSSLDPNNEENIGALEDIAKKSLPEMERKKILRIVHLSGNSGNLY